MIVMDYLFTCQHSYFTTLQTLSLSLPPGMSLSLKREFGDWEAIQITGRNTTFTVEKLMCGTKYQMYMTAHNRIGASAPSDLLETKTSGTGEELLNKMTLIHFRCNRILIRYEYTIIIKSQQ